MRDSKRDTDVQDSLLDSVGEGEGGMIWENGIETCIISYKKRKKNKKRLAIVQSLKKKKSYLMVSFYWRVQFIVIILVSWNDKPRQHVKEQRHHFVDKGPYSQSPGISTSHIQM